MVKKYRQVPVEIEAIQWTGNNFDEINSFLDGGAHLYSGCLFVQTHTGEVTANASDYIAKSGTENYPIIRVIDADMFEKVYMEVETA